MDFGCRQRAPQPTLCLSKAVDTIHLYIEGFSSQVGYVDRSKIYFGAEMHSHGSYCKCQVLRKAKLQALRALRSQPPPCSTKDYIPNRPTGRLNTNRLSIGQVYRVRSTKYRVFPLRSLVTPLCFVIEYRAICGHFPSASLVFVFVLE